MGVTNIDSLAESLPSSIFVDSLDMLRANPENLFSRIIPGDETCVHLHDPETKHESMQWKQKGSPTPKKFRVQQSAGKIMATIF